MHRGELDRALGAPYSGTMLPGVVREFVRTWTGFEDGYVYLNLSPSPGASTTGFVIQLEQNQCERLDTWESTYDWVRIGDLETYVANRQSHGRGSVVRGSYLRLVRAASLEPLPQLPGHLTVAEEA